MDNYVAISELNPMYLVKKGKTLIPQYNTKFNDEFLDAESRKLWQGYGRYYQKWQTSDVIPYQIISNVAPISLRVYTCKGHRVLTLNFTQKQQNRYSPGTYIYEATVSLAAFAAGRYYIEFLIGDPVLETLTTDYFDVATTWPNTVLLQYTNSFYYADAIFGTGWAPNFRIEGWFKDNAPVSKDEAYIDQVYNARMLFSDPYKTRKFIVGPGTGVPDWTPDKLNWILGCDEVYYDGRLMTKVEGGKWADEAVDSHPFRGYSIDLQESNRRSSRIFPVNPSVGGKKLLVALNVDTQGFADTTTGASSNVIQITNVE